VITVKAVDFRAQSYCRQAFGDLGELAQRMTETLIHRRGFPSIRPWTHRVKEAPDWTFDTMIGTGLSGAMVIPSIARILNVRWALVRKPSESTHSPLPIEGEIGARWLFVDDFTITRATQRHVIGTVVQVCASTRFIGTYMYQRDYFEPAHVALDYTENVNCPCCEDSRAEPGKGVASLPPSVPSW